MDVLSYIIASRLLSCSGGNGANIRLDENVKGFKIAGRDGDYLELEVE